MANQLDNFIRKFEEIKIPVPFGYLAAKWWGPQNVRPIVALHGWQDNAGTFDTLIPLLPDHLSYLAIDLPGHGLSSRLQPGVLYSDIENLFILHRLFKTHFKWDKVSLMGHSMSSITSFLYAATFPDYCDMVIAFDVLKPHVSNAARVSGFLAALGGSVLKAAQQNDSNSEPPSYTYEELIDIQVVGTGGSVTAETAPYLLKRGSKPSKTHPNKYYFSRDSRLKVMNNHMFTQEANGLLASQIKCPYLFVKATESAYTEIERQFYFQYIAEIMQANNKTFEIYDVEGGHHAHLTVPHNMNKKLSEFIHKYRPPVVISKL